MRQRFQALLAHRSNGLPPPSDALGMAQVAFLAMRGCDILSAEVTGAQMRVHFEVTGELQEPIPVADLRAAVEDCLEGHVSLSVLSVRQSIGTAAVAEVERILGAK